ncbi:MAG: hypothetical protein QF599_06415, partial [Planctomycetota bacterium]|nr:hypothetical protein [Planctomycetota bacterium]
MPVTRLPILFLAFSLAACGADELDSGAAADAASDNAPAVPLPERIVIEEPTPPIRFLETVEDLSEEVADRFLDFSSDIQKRDFAGAAEFLAADFAAMGLDGLELTTTKSGHLGTSDEIFAVDGAAVVGAAGFMAGIESWTGRWARIENILWKTKGAEFRAGAGERWGRVHLKVSMLGEDSAGQREEFTAWAWARVERAEGEWYFTRFQLESAHLRRAGRRMFTDVSAAAGLAQRGIRYGQPGNDTDHWQGVAAGDVDGDGLWDLFMPGRGRNFLYQRKGGGPF